MDSLLVKVFFRGETIVEKSLLVDLFKLFDNPQAVNFILSLSFVDYITLALVAILLLADHLDVHAVSERGGIVSYIDRNWRL